MASSSPSASLLPPAPADTPATVRDPGRLAQLAQAIASLEVSPVDLLERSLARIAETEPAIEGWRELDADRARQAARDRAAEAKSGSLRGPLHGIPVGIKDIIDVEGLPTRCNSRSRANAAAASCDAEIVMQLRAQGAVIVGKTHTTEFAFFDPSPARNPHNPAHTPGGSSSGSAAVVAAGMVPLSLGTQTVASVNRPAAYCGISAFKPSTRSMPAYGIAPLAPSYDTVGFYGWRVDDAAFAFEALAPRFLQPAAALPASLNVLVPEDPHLDDISGDAARVFEATAAALAHAGHRITRHRAPISFARLCDIQRSTMLYEAGHAMRPFLDLPKGDIGAKLEEAIRNGLEMPLSRYLDERREIAAMRRAVLEWSAAFDCVLWPATPDTAPQGLGWTGDPRYISPWTAIGGPMVTMPCGFAANGLPLGCLVIGAPGRDLTVAQLARRIAEVAEVPA